MKNRMVALLVGISMAALFTGGCANTEAVKKEEAIAPTVAVEKAEPAKPAQPAVQPKAVEQVKPAVSTPAAPAAPTSAAVSKFETIYFDFDKSDLRTDARDVLSKNAAAILKAAAGTKVQVEGHCDERGSAEYNLALGERRAKSVQKYLTTLNVKAENLSIISYGKEKPAVSGSDEAAWSKNRRAELVVVK